MVQLEFKPFPSFSNKAVPSPSSHPKLSLVLDPAILQHYSLLLSSSSLGALALPNNLEWFPTLVLCSFMCP